MKIRIKSNSVRYRLTRTDVAQLAESGFIEDKVSFAHQSLLYALQLTLDEQLSATYINNTITLMMPKIMIDELTNSDTVGFENSENGLHLLVEKDFTCLDNVEEDQSDNYPNPLAEKAI
jgi:hypothetical protein